MEVRDKVFVVTGGGNGIGRHLVLQLLARGAAEQGNSMRTTSAEDTARIIIDGIENDRLHILVGTDSKMMNLAVRVSPRRATHMIQKRMKGLLAS